MHSNKDSRNPEAAWDREFPCQPRVVNYSLIAMAIFCAVSLAAAGLFFGLRRHRAEISEPAVYENLAMQAQLTAQSHIALSALATFLSSENEVLRIAQIRPLPGIGGRYLAAKPQLDLLKKSAPVPGGELLSRPPFLGIPLTFPQAEPRIAWFEMIGGAARLDLDSLFVLSDVPWGELPSTPIGRVQVVRGYITAIDPENATITVESPNHDQPHMVLVLGNFTALADLKFPQAATLTIIRLPESPIHRARWKLRTLHSLDWLKSES